MAATPFFVHHAWNARFCRSAVSRVSAYGFAVRSRFASAYSRRGSLSSRFRIRWFQQRCRWARGNTILRAAYHVLATGTSYRDPGPDYGDPRHAQRVTRRAIDLFQHHG